MKVRCTAWSEVVAVVLPWSTLVFRGTVKGHGNAVPQVDDMVYEAVVLCIAGVRADPHSCAPFELTDRSPSR